MKRSRFKLYWRGALFLLLCLVVTAAMGATSALAKDTRSDERRVGKGCRSRWSPEHEKKK